MIVALENPIRSYDWGSITALPEILGVAPTGRPQSELWVGAHPGAPSRVVDADVALDAFVAADPRARLGAASTARFGDRLPFLLKILTVERPLSIQVHPTIAQAEAGYADDDAAGLALSAPQRRYRDRSHKPEMVVAVTPFDALIGFAEPEASADELHRFALRGLDPVVAALRTGSLRDAVGHLLALPDDDASALAAGVVAAAVRAGSDDTGLFDLVARLAVDYPADRGILLALLMEQVRLQPGETAFVPAGVPHAYLHGVAIEPQASSDNTLRAGLTPKFVDVAEVGRILRYEPGGMVAVAARPTGRPGSEAVFAAPVDEFELTRWDLDPATAASIGDGRESPWVVLVLAGTAEVVAADVVVPLRPGQAAFVPAADAATVPTLRGSGTVFGVTTPGT